MTPRPPQLSKREPMKQRIALISTGGTIEKTLARKGTYRMTKWRPKETAIATRSHGLTHGGIVTSEPSSEIALSALNISMVTRTERDIVLAVSLPALM